MLLRSQAAASARRRRSLARECACWRKQLSGAACCPRRALAIAWSGDVSCRSTSPEPRFPETADDVRAERAEVAVKSASKRPEWRRPRSSGLSHTRARLATAVGWQGMAREKNVSRPARLAWHLSGGERETVPLCCFSCRADGLSQDTWCRCALLSSKLRRRAPVSSLRQRAAQG